MASYVDAGTQTVWAGLMQQSVRPEALFSAPKDTSTPPAEMVTEKSQFEDAIPTITRSQHDGHDDSSPQPTLIERRQGRSGLITRISLPNSDLNDEVPLSPPPTHAILSPLPEANTRHAGHTPLIPRARSPDAEEGMRDLLSPIPQGIAEGKPPATVEEDEALTGSLVLPTDPLAENDDPVYISLGALDQELEKIARQQRHLRGEFSDDEEDPEPPKNSEKEEVLADASSAPTLPENEVPRRSSSQSGLMLEQPGSLNPNSGPSLSSISSPPIVTSRAPVQAFSPPIQPVTVENHDDDLPLSRQASDDSRRSAITDEVDGVKLKTPPSNFGAPFGHL